MQRALETQEASGCAATNGEDARRDALTIDAWMTKAIADPKARGDRLAHQELATMKRTAKASWATFALLMSGCTTAPPTPPSTVPELAYQLSQDGILFDQPRFDEIVGGANLKQGDPTRVSGVTLDVTSTRGKDKHIREADFDLAGTCTRVADLVARFGKPTVWNAITDGGGLSYAWDIQRRGGNVRLGLSGGMMKDDECAKRLWVAQPWDLS